MTPRTINQDLLQEIEGWLHPLFGTISCFEIYDHHYNIFSEIIKVKCLHDQVERNFVIKKYIAGRRSSHDLRSCIQNEYNILSYLHDRFSDLHGFNVIRPFAILLDRNILITEDFPGNKLNRLILNNARWIPSKFGIKRLRSYLFQVGKWLKYFQQFTKRKELFSFQESDYLEKIQKRLALSTQYGLLETDHYKIYDFVADKIPKMSHLLLESVGYHGDFTPWNILATEDEIRVLDFDRFSYRSKYDDLTFFISALEGNKSILGMQNQNINFLMKSFWNGYGLQQMDLNFLNLYMLLNTLKNLNNIDLNQNSNTKIFDILYERYRKRRLINLYLKNILDGIGSENFLMLE
jgi:hypothetical protein